MRASDTSEVVFDNCRIPADQLLGQEGRGFLDTMQVLDAGRIGIAALAVGLAQGAYEAALHYARERKAFGKQLIDFQNTQFKLAECKTEATVAKVFCNHCTELHLEKKLTPYMASMAKLWLTDLQCKIVDECLQLFGGYGYMNEYPIARMYADSRVQKIYGGTNEIMKEVITRSMGLPGR